ncbi:hypothetical protein KAFR_0A03350 [Kazachstania africana CBS 2517]|uniref:Uncharacterized protein n=1 Tax=Kazachstania africana (strain ATCC 22294 / BCRC 22015 / CBS 2517 / CECT 1963 / NBRC 1671 / NRRL Y-8276) TaxID=1071382 RepID=H2AN20_KAZAF|nr:hypothetical protein KAFR_0A03350 [Kazachstania africana CBS 2517]CCF55770.1 hypothetical protein KAFR_0A03350 [Kazachstania africana CBS 2517]
MNETKDYANEDTQAEGLIYSRPIYLSRVKKERISKKQEKKANPKGMRKRTFKVRKAAHFDRHLHFVNIETSYQSCSRSAESKSNSNKHQDSKKYYEYGETISGYKFIGEEKVRSQPVADPAHFFEDNEVERETRETTLLFDVTKSTKDLDFIKKYWKSYHNGSISSSSSSVLLPLYRYNSSLAETNIEQITTESVRTFYELSCNAVRKDWETLLKKERIRWHPDKFSRISPETSLKKVTKLFQIINQLWEITKSTGR